MGLDVGPVNSAAVILDDSTNVITGKFICENQLLIRLLKAELGGDSARVGIETISSYGQVVSSDVFRTCEWCGVFACGVASFVTTQNDILRVSRIDAKKAVCYSGRANDAQIRACLIERFSGKNNLSGGGKIPAIGLKNSPGPLYGVVKDMWAALAVAVTVVDQWENLPEFDISACLE